MSECPTDDIPVFYACISATPEGPSIEIAWASPACEAHGVTCESHLIQPPAARSAELAQDLVAAQVYGLALSDLQQFGTTPSELVPDMNDALAKRDLFSATTAGDGSIRRIFDAANTAPKFALPRTNAETLITELARLRCLSPADLAHAKREAEVLCLTGIRAEAKPRYLATYWGFVAGRQ